MKKNCPLINFVVNGQKVLSVEKKCLLVEKFVLPVEVFFLSVEIFLSVVLALLC